MTALPANGNGSAARWQLLVSIAAVTIAIGGALLTLLLNINTLANTVSNQSIRLSALETAQHEADNRRGTFQADIAGIHRDLVEIETQFCAEDSMRNLTHARDLRDFAILWRRAFGDDYPLSNVYYPSIGRCGLAAPTGH